jgi:triphosphatase
MIDQCGDGCYHSPPLPGALAEVVANSMQGRVLDQQEVEWQFEAADLDLVENWLEGHPSASGLTLVRGATTELTDAYYDTEDWCFYRAGYALRVRRDGKSSEATMKSLTPAEGALRRRREISEPLAGGIEALWRTSGPVGERLRALVGDQDPRPLFEIRTRRRTFELRPEGADGNISVGEISLDEVEILGEAPTRLSRIEVEVAPDARLRDIVEGFVDWLRNALRLRPAETSKFRVGLSAAGLNPVVPELGPEEWAERASEKGGR